MEWQELRRKGGGNPVVVYSSEYSGHDLPHAINNLVAFVKWNVQRFLGASYLVFMWDPVNMLLVVFGETDSGHLSEGQVEVAFLAGQKLLEDESPILNLLEEMAEDVRRYVFGAVEQHFAALNLGFKICFLFDRSASREDYEIILG